MTSESGDHGNNEYNYIGIDLSDSLDGIKMNTMQQDNYTEITDEDFNRTNEVWAHKTLVKSCHFFELKCLYQSRKMSSHVYMYTMRFEFNVLRMFF
jgi:hypothetical protein